jgi:hypothetical protein
LDFRKFLKGSNKWCLCVCMCNIYIYINHDRTRFRERRVGFNIGK